MPETTYRLERFNWRRAEEGLLLLPGCNPISSFQDRDVADVEYRQREWQVRRRVNPFRCGGPFLHYQTGFDAARLFDWCLDIGLEPPGLTNVSSSWADWWREQHTIMTDLQRTSMWEALDRVRFFRVVEAERGIPCHLVARPHTEEDPLGPRHLGQYRYVGSTPDMLSRSQATADALCHELFIHRLASEGGYIGNYPAPASWLIPDDDPFGPADESRGFQYWLDNYAERRPIELIADKESNPGQTLYVVLRRHWRLEIDGDAWRWSPTQKRSCGRPVLAFSTLAAADASLACLEAEAREHPAPFRFGPPHEWFSLDSSTIWGVLSELAPIRFTSQWEDYKASDPLWCRWWDEVVPSLGGSEIETVWSLYDKLRFYEIVSVEYRE